jgi:hypothetical protein
VLASSSILCHRSVFILVNISFYDFSHINKGVLNEVHDLLIILELKPLRIYFNSKQWLYWCPMLILVLLYLEETSFQFLFLAESAKMLVDRWVTMYQIVHGTKGHMAVYGTGCHPQNIIWTEAKLRSIYYFVGDRPVHKQPFGPILTGQYFSIWTGADQYNVFFQILSELVFCLRYTITKTCHLTDLYVLSII